MNLYNTLTKKVEALTPLNPEQLRMYSCGPTVYNHAHIGNLSAYIFADTLRRVLGLDGTVVKQVMNYTDVDDKTITRSREAYPELEPREALRTLTNKYIDVFLDDMQRIGNDIKAITFMRATDNIEPMKALITKLYQGGFAYIADDGIYFSIEAYQKSGKQYGQLLELSAQHTSEARIQNDEYDKESVHDFALWKKQKANEPAWEFTLDGHDMSGRPGWHIECSAMSRAGLGQPFDIHTGGVDLIFPHHENEIAQSTAGEDNPVMAATFAHNDHILVDGKKMAKSANNFFTLQDVMQKGYDPLAFRLMILQAHYRSQVNFTWGSLEAAQNRLTNWRAFADLRFQANEAVTSELGPYFSGKQEEIRNALESDLNTPEVMRLVSEMIDVAEQKGISTADTKAFGELLGLLDAALGLGLSDREDLTKEQKQLIAEREAARHAKDWAKADQLRNELTAAGIGVRDTERGSVWYRL